MPPSQILEVYARNLFMNSIKIVADMSKAEAQKAEAQAGL